ncbi:MAG TPA: type VI secretion system tip protein TssI/VgrG [Byssovorax sp.]|jgi:type VI secretion system secreted protein VgrG
MTRAPLTSTLEIDGHALTVAAFRGEERMSTPFRVDVSVLLEQHHALSPDACVKRAATLHLQRGAEHVRSISGIVTDVAVEAALRHGTRRAELVLEPRLALARFRKDVRIFREMTVPEIVVDVLSQIGVAPELRLARDYERRHDTVQYRERDLDFVHRLLEDEGIFYYFLEGGEMVLGDGEASYELVAGERAIPFRQGFGASQNEDAVYDLGERASVAASQVSLRDFNPEKPKLDMDVASVTSSRVSSEWYDHPGRYGAPEAGAARAALMAEAVSCHAAAFVGRSFSGRLVPGAVFHLVDAPPGLEDGGYVVTAVRHDWAIEAGGFSCDFEARDGESTFRPARVTPSPRITGPLTGFVTGPAGADDIYTDAWGRVKVQLHWDRRLPADEGCTYWIPVLQDNTGHSSAIPRRGWEVLVHFLEGDPDKPVVLGRVYNADDRIWEKLPDYKHRTALRSLSTPSRDGKNEIRFQDLAGSEEIHVHAQRDQLIHVANDKQEIIVANEAHEIHGNESITIGVDHTATVTSTSDVRTTGDQTVTVGGDSTKSTATQDATSVSGSRTVDVAGSYHLRISGKSAATATNMVERVGGVILETSLKSNGTIAQTVGTLTVGGAVVEVCKNSKTESTQKVRAETVGGAQMISANDIATHAGKSRTTSAGMLRADTTAEITISGIDENTFDLGAGAFTADTTIQLKVGENVVTLKDGTIDVTAASIIQIGVHGKNAQGAADSKQNSD